MQDFYLQYFIADFDNDFYIKNIFYCSYNVIYIMKNLIFRLSDYILFRTSEYNTVNNTVNTHIHIGANLYKTPSKAARSGMRRFSFKICRAISIKCSLLSYPELLLPYCYRW